MVPPVNKTSWAGVIIGRSGRFVYGVLEEIHPVVAVLGPSDPPVLQTYDQRYVVFVATAGGTTHITCIDHIGGLGLFKSPGYGTNMQLLLSECGAARQLAALEITPNTANTHEGGNTGFSLACEALVPKN